MIYSELMLISSSLSYLLLTQRYIMIYRTKIFLKNILYSPKNLKNYVKTYPINSIPKAAAILSAFSLKLSSNN